MRKHHIQNIIVKNLVSLKAFEETALETVETSDSELKKLQLQLEFKRECPLRPIGKGHMMKNRMSSYFVHS